MVSGSQSPLPPTIVVLPQEFRGQISLRQLAKNLNADRRNLKRAKKWLIENKHSSFEGYVTGSSLSTQQASAIINYRSYTTAGLKGDALTEKMFPDTVTPNARKNALRDLFEQAQIPPEQAAQLTYSILEIFKS